MNATMQEHHRGMGQKWQEVQSGHPIPRDPPPILDAPSAIHTLPQQTQ